MIKKNKSTKYHFFIYHKWTQKTNRDISRTVFGPARPKGMSPCNRPCLIQEKDYGPTCLTCPRTRVPDPKWQEAQEGRAPIDSLNFFRPVNMHLLRIRALYVPGLSSSNDTTHRHGACSAVRCCARVDHQGWQASNGGTQSAPPRPLARCPRPRSPSPHARSHYPPIHSARAQSNCNRQRDATRPSRSHCTTVGACQNPSKTCPHCLLQFHSIPLPPQARESTKPLPRTRGSILLDLAPTASTTAAGAS